MNEELPQDNLTVEQWIEILNSYFYTKEEQKENEIVNSQNVSLDTQELILKLDEVNTSVETMNTMFYYFVIGILSVFIILVYYKFLKPFIERWY